MSHESAKLSSGTVIDTSASLRLVTCQPLMSLDVWANDCFDQHCEMFSH